MDARFWHDRWERQETGFHQSAANPRLTRNFGALSLAPGSRVFLPLCGKSLDLHWLLAQGCRVVGAELSRIAVEQLFSELGVEPVVEPLGGHSRFRAEGIDVFVGDIFDLSPAVLGPVDAVYDRAALVALPAPMRERYAAHLVGLTEGAPQLVVSYVYEQSVVSGPPFSVADDEVARLYGGTYDLALIERVEVEGGLKGKCAALEQVWRMTPRRAG